MAIGHHHPPSSLLGLVWACSSSEGARHCNESIDNGWMVDTWLRFSLSVSRSATWLRLKQPAAGPGPGPGPVHTHLFFLSKWLPSLLNYGTLVGAKLPGICILSLSSFLFTMIFFFFFFQGHMANNVGAVLVTVLDTDYCLASSIFLNYKCFGWKPVQISDYQSVPIYADGARYMKLLYERFKKTTCLRPCLSPLRIPNINSTARGPPFQI